MSEVEYMSAEIAFPAYLGGEQCRVLRGPYLASSIARTGSEWRFVHGKEAKTYTGSGWKTAGWKTSEDATNRHIERKRTGKR